MLKNIRSVISIKFVIGILLIIGGMMLVGFPFFQDWKNDCKVTQISEEINASTTSTNTSKEKTLQIKDKWPVEAILSIPKINFEMPVIQDATKAHLDVSVSSINGTAKPWERGNYVIAGHRSLHYGRHFNRLDELTVNDSIIVTDMEKNEYHYCVFGVTVVDESEVGILESGDTDHITLITCDPKYEKHPKKRLVVKAVKIN